METASAPRAMASSTVQTSTLSFGSGLSEVLPERCTKSPMSRPVPPVSPLDHPLVEDDRVCPALAHISDDFCHVQQAVDLAHGKTVVHGNYHGPPCVPVDDPFDPDIFSNHDATLPLRTLSASSTLLFWCTIQAAARTNLSGVRCWKAFRPIEIPAAPPAIAPSINSNVVRSSVFEPPATTTGTGQPRVTSRKDSGRRCTRS